MQEQVDIASTPLPNTLTQENVIMPTARARMFYQCFYEYTDQLCRVIEKCSETLCASIARIPFGMIGPGSDAYIEAHLSSLADIAAEYVATWSMLICEGNVSKDADEWYPEEWLIGGFNHEFAQTFGSTHQDATNLSKEYLCSQLTGKLQHRIVTAIAKEMLLIRSTLAIHSMTEIEHRSDKRNILDDILVGIATYYRITIWNLRVGFPLNNRMRLMAVPLDQCSISEPDASQAQSEPAMLGRKRDRHLKKNEFRERVIKSQIECVVAAGSRYP